MRPSSDLRLGILPGRFSKEKLAELARRLRQKRDQKRGQGNNPKLDDMLAETEPRAEVEIANYTTQILKGFSTQCWPA